MGGLVGDSRGSSGGFIVRLPAVRIEAELELGGPRFGGLGVGRRGAELELGDPRAFGVSVGLDTPACVDEERQIVQVFWSSRYSLVDDEVI